MSDHQTTPSDERDTDTSARVKALVGRRFLGFLWIAKRPCGKVSAMSWEDRGAEVEVAESIARWRDRGDAVERVARYEGDPQPEWICRAGCDDCMH